MNLLAHRNLFRDKIRLTVTLTGMVLALVLIVVEMGLFVGFRKEISSVLDHSHADLWVTARRVPYFDIGIFLNERKLYQVKSAAGVADAEKFILQWSRWNRLDSRQQQIEVIGFNPDAGIGGPWNVVEGRVQDVKTPDGVIVDEFYKNILGITAIGEVFEINGHRARVVGFTRGIRAFTTSPYVFTSLHSALGYAQMRADQTTYIVVRITPGANPEEVRKAILERVEGVDVLTTAEFSQRTRRYWTYTTGAGLALLSGALLGLIVGFVVVAQTMYATTMDHLKEFGTLKAMGASNSYVCGVILVQAIIGGLIGYGIGMILSTLVIRFAQSAGAVILITWWIGVGTFFLNLFMCAGAALISIKKVMGIDPAMVFKA
jgi:putative ABC transport system permease protein